MILASLLILTFATAFTWAQNQSLKARMSRVEKHEAWRERGLL